MLLEPMMDAHAHALAPRSGRAAVIEIALRLRVRDERDGSALELDNAVPGYEPKVGDRVVYFADSSGAAAIGVLPTPGALLEAALDAHDKRVVHDKRGAVIFEYDPSADRAVVRVPEGDLALEVKGALRIGAREVEIVAHDREGVDAHLKVAPGAITMLARKVDLLASSIGLRARRLETHVERALQVAEVVETRAGRLVERARDAYREVERLSQHRAGRLKWIADTTASLVSEDTILSARDRVKVRGERIHLG